jgi:hypothetical protein
MSVKGDIVRGKEKKKEEVWALNGRRPVSEWAKNVQEETLLLEISEVQMRWIEWPEW